MPDVHLEYINEVNIRVRADLSTLMEIKEHFTYFAENYRFHPKFRSRAWDGKISLMKQGGIIYAGLAQRIKKFCESRDYTVTWDDELFYENISKAELLEFIEFLNIPDKFESRDYQIDSILKCLRSRRRTLLSPTASGKSFMIYVITQWYAIKHNLRSLIVVPTVGLVSQMGSDFRDYGYEGTIHQSTDGLSKGQIEEDLTITTWQSLTNAKSKRPPKWYDQFGCVVIDEAHQAKAKSLIDIMTSMPNCRYRFGTTGTLDNKTLNTMTIEGLFGSQYQAITTKELIDEGFATPIKIKCLVLKYDEETCKAFHKEHQALKKNKNKKGSEAYNHEVEWLVNNKKRTKFITNLIKSLEGNKLLFFRRRDHGKVFYDALTDATDDTIFYIDGEVKADEREAIRHAIEDEHNATLVGSMGTTSTGINVKKLHHMLAGAPSKSRIKVFQSIGRMLRKHHSKERVVLYDIVDDISHGSKKNYTLDHFVERTQMYDSEQFDWDIYSIKL